jgi:regulator of protease activity HflC (stomatin/prohibitin superfamily)
MSFWIDDNSFPRFGRIIGSFAIFFAVLWLALSSFVVVPAGYVGVVLQLGAVQGVLGSGFHVITPVVQSVVLMETRTQKYEVDATAATKDLLDVTTKVAVNFHISPEAANKLYQDIGMDYEGRIIAPAVQETVKATTAKFEAAQLINERPVVKQQIDAALAERMQSRDIIIETISLTDYKFPPAFNEAIVNKQTAVQKAQEATNKLEQIKVEAEQAIAKARGDAESIRIINEQLLKSPQYIQLLAVQKWDGKLPYATSGIPFLQLPLGAATSSNSTSG